jgi:hypothetical protein
MQSLTQNLEDVVEQMERNGDVQRRRWPITNTVNGISIEIATVQESLWKTNLERAQRRLLLVHCHVLCHKVA